MDSIKCPFEQIHFLSLYLLLDDIIPSKFKNLLYIVDIQTYGSQIYILNIDFCLESQKFISTTNPTGPPNLAPYSCCCLPQLMVLASTTCVSQLPWQLSWLRIHLRCRRPRFDSQAGKIPWRRKWQPTPVILPGESPWTEEPGSLLHSMGLPRVRHDLATKPPPPA